ncbi:MFS transporter [Cupriavidus necator]
MESESTLAEWSPGRARCSNPGKTGKALLVTGAALGMLVGFSAAYFSTLSLFLKPIAATFGWGRAQTSAISVLAQLGLAMGAPFVGRLIDRFGANRVIPVSVVLFAIGMATLSVIPNSIVFFGGMSFLLGAMAVGTTPTGYLSVLPGAFDRRLGCAMGIAMVGLGCGNALMPLLTEHWMGAGGWRVAYQYLAATTLAGGLLAVVLFSSVAGHARRQGMEEIELPGIGFRGAIRSSRFWVIAAILFVISAAGLGAIVHMVPLLTDRGFPSQQASQIAALIGLGVMVGRAGTGLLIDMAHAPYVAAVSFLMGATGLAVIALQPDASMATVGTGAFLFAFAIGAEGDFIPFFVRRYFGLRQFGFLYGTFFFVFALGGVAGPVLYGLAFDKTGSYTTAFACATAACTVSAIAVSLLGKYRYAAKN